MGRRALFSFITDHRKRLLKMMPKRSICAEIGVWKGDFSQRILDIANPSELHLIDPWMFQPSLPSRWYGGVKAANQSDMDEIFESVRDRFASFPEVRFHRKPSEEAYSEFPNEFFDWVYVDGNHDYDSVKADLELYFPKIKPNGFLTGDDYFLPSLETGETAPVKEAVQDFMNENQASVLKLIGGQFIIQKN